jgi:hypothetical protein
VFVIGRLVEELFIDRFGGCSSDHSSKRFQRDLEELIVHLSDSLRLRDECFVIRFRIFGADFDGFLERFGARQFFEKCDSFLKGSLV